MVEAVGAALAARGIQVVGSAPDGEDAVEQIERLRPAVALLDIRMPRLSGLEVARRVARSAPSTAVIVYTALAEKALLQEALDAGVRGFVLKEAPLGELVRAVEMVADAKFYVDPALAWPIASSDAAASAARLTVREREILRLLADGHSNDEIGRKLEISPETVRSHVRKAMQKLHAETRTQAVAIALRESLIA